MSYTEDGKMLQQIMTAPGEIQFQRVAIPEIHKDELLVRVERIGICGSDIHVYHGTHPFTQYPITQGHEVSAVVVQIGAEAAGFSVGQKVTIQPQVVCGKCYPCRHGRYNLCEELKVMGFQTTGMASEYFSVSAGKALPLPETMSLDEGAMIEPLAVAVHGIRRFGEMKGTKVAVLGAGPIGNLVAQTARAEGADVMLCDISQYRLELAKKCGIEHTFHTGNTDFGEAMIQTFGPDKADVIYDCAANDVTMGQAIRYARKGSKVVLVGVYAGMATVDLATLNDHELDLDTTMMYRVEDYRRAIQLAAEKRVRLEPLMSKHFPFREYLDAYRYIDQNREYTMKVIIDVQM